MPALNDVGERLAKVAERSTRSAKQVIDRARKRPLIVAGLVIAVFLVAIFSSVALARKTVEVAVDGRTVVVHTWAKTVGEALEAAGVKLNLGDKVSPSTGDPLAKRTLVAVERAFPVSVKFDGKTATAMVTAKTAIVALREADIPVGANDRIVVTVDKQVVKSEILAPGATVEVFRRATTVVTEKRTVPAETVYRDDVELPIGLTKVLQEGKNGVAEVTLEVVTENGRRVSSKELSRQVTEEPQMKVVLKGTSGTVTRGGREITFKKAFSMVATAYYPGPDSTGPGATGYTSIGMKATYGVVAVDPRVIPMRSLLYIDGYGYAIAGDVGGAIKGNKIDLCYDTKQEALDWGKRTVTVFLIK